MAQIGFPAGVHLARSRKSSHFPNALWQHVNMIKISNLFQANGVSWKHRDFAELVAFGHIAVLCLFCTICAGNWQAYSKKCRTDVNLV